MIAQDFRIRLCTVEDTDWLISLAQDSYDRPLDLDGCRSFIATATAAPNECFFARTENGVGVALAQAEFHAPHILAAHMLFLMARPNCGIEGYRLLKAMITWAKSRGVKTFHFGESTGVNLAPFAARIGAQLDRPSWRLEL